MIALNNGALESTFWAVGEGKVLFSRYLKPGMFGLGIVLKKIFLTYSAHFVFSTVRLVPGNPVMVIIDISGKSSIWNYVKIGIF